MARKQLGAAPAVATDAATKGYVDDVAASLGAVVVAESGQPPAYPPRPSVLSPVVFVGTLNPSSLMLDGDVWIELGSEGPSQPLPVSQGGTGANGPDQALENLGAAWAVARPLTTQHLDAVQTPGFYSQPIAANAQTVEKGYPIPQGGLLEVLASSDRTLLWQRYTPMGTDAYSEWVRPYQSGTWGPWRRSSGEPRGFTSDWWWMASSDGFYSELYFRAENGYLRTQGYLMPRSVYLTGPLGIGAMPPELRPRAASRARVDTYIPTSVNRMGVSFYCKIEANGTLGLYPSPYQTAVTLYTDNHVTPHIPPYRVAG